MTTSSKGDRPFRSILCPIDFSAHSRLALRAAASVADLFGASITLLFVEDPLLAQAASAALDPRALAKSTESELRRFVQRSIGRDGRDRAITYRIVTGRPPIEIRKAVRRTSTDLIVMGTHGLSGAKKLVIGSTTEAVLRDTRVPVLAVPPGAARVVRRRGWPGKTIVAAIELDNHPSRDVRRAARVARSLRTSLLLVHVVRPVAGPPWLQPQLSSQDRVRLTAARDRLQALGASVKGVKVQTRTALGDPAVGIAALVADQNAGLLIMILRRGRGLFGPRRGSITYRVLSGTTTPLLAIPSEALSDA